MDWGQAASSAEANVVQLSNYVPPNYNIRDHGMLIGISNEMVQLFRDIDRLARRDDTVLIVGESGTGKGRIASALHYNGGRREKGKFVTVNCGAISKDLIESELFGHEKGSFTGAHAKRDGVFVEANDGTLFLDEIGDMPLDMQVKTLRAIEEGVVKPVGSSKEIEVSVRIVVATHRDLEEEIRGKRFREDLYYRLNVVDLHVAPLRERREDLGFIVEYIIASLNSKERRNMTGLTPEAQEWFRQNPWPGNIRQVENLLEKAFALKPYDGPISLEELRIENTRRRVSAYTETSKAYHVLPVLSTSLSEIEGSCSWKTIRKRVKEGVLSDIPIFVDEVDGTKIIYITPESAGFFFAKRTTAYDELIEKIYTSKFSDTFSRPFAVYSQLSLMQELGIESVNVKGIMHSNGVYELGIHPMKRLYAVTMKDEQALYSVCGATGLTSEESRSRVERFFERMDERYRLLKQGNALAPSLN